MALGRLRVALGLDRRHPLIFLSRCSSICTGIGDNTALFPDPAPQISVVQGQIQVATAAQQLLAKVKGSGARDLAFGVVATSMETLRAMVQSLCDQSPEQANTLIEASSMRAFSVGVHHKDLLALKNGVTPGSVLLKANAGLLDRSTRRKVYNWEGTTNGGSSYFAMPSTSYARTSIANLTPLTMVGFRVCVAVGEQPPGAWSQMLPTHLVEQLPALELRVVA